MNKGSLLLSNALTLLEELNSGTGNSLFASGQLARNCEIITELTFTARKSSQDEVCKYISTIESFSGNLEGDAWKGLYNNASSLCIDFISDENWVIDNFIKSATPEHLALLDEFDEPVLRLKNISSEEEIYASINMQFIPTPMREGLREVEQAKAHKIPLQKIK